jgi:large subunit ribosomal protein L27
VTGNILYKQRGTLWWPGENCFMGRDHTIHAGATGYVKYYRDLARHPDRKYIGVVFNKSDTLPYPPNAERKRKLNMTLLPIHKPTPEPELSESGIPSMVTREVSTKVNGLAQGPKILRLRKDYSYREDNWRIGQLVDIVALKKRRRSKRSVFRQRRWIRERQLAGEKKAYIKRAEMEVENPGTNARMAAKRSAAQAKGKGKKKQKAKKR